ncbi:putative membrane protein [Loktanella sp. DSM 29012]|uniref:YcjF family protein n=1 Tax=Loktanella sp. DSM 29012 TaxID=1881056 RepID=UPI0008CD59E7|nr:TIGR01620 family protein [Loktanella sp. DSM 29012]SEQ02863.1 putative membrane protein [Loktanella sp. DSM 29012]
MKRPVLIDLDGPADQTPATAPAIVDDLPQGAAMQSVVALGTRKPNPLARWFWSLLLVIFGFIISLAAWNYVTGLVAAHPILGMVFTGLLILFVCVCLAVVIRELSAFSRLRRIDRVQADAAQAHAGHDLKAARKVVDQLTALYAGRDDTSWGRAQLADRAPELMDADGLLDLAERSLLVPLDARAVAEVQAAARQVALVTAVVPLALADVFTALTANIRMIRRIAEIYGGRSGTLGSLRLVRTVLSHLVATGAVAVGDDLIGSVAGGGLLSKVSRRFGEGIVNGALTARVGVAAIEVCRPLPFQAVKRPSVTGLVQRALTGLFGS